MLTRSVRMTDQVMPYIRKESSVCPQSLVWSGGLGGLEATTTALCPKAGSNRPGRGQGLRMRSEMQLTVTLRLRSGGSNSPRVWERGGRGLLGERWGDSQPTTAGGGGPDCQGMAAQAHAQQDNRRRRLCNRDSKGDNPLFGLWRMIGMCVCVCVCELVALSLASETLARQDGRRPLSRMEEVSRDRHFQGSKLLTYLLCQLSASRCWRRRRDTVFSMAIEVHIRVVCMIPSRGMHYTAQSPNHGSPSSTFIYGLPKHPAHPHSHPISTLHHSSSILFPFPALNPDMRSHERQTRPTSYTHVSPRSKSNPSPSHIARDEH
ncbi:hypothetical protein P280DRAFT_217935 [Massarina eburnea CBS 473.64]|uniref:Uncharacterized protein n=1 Tax=Massarina eburnea CBS 473.64 TaxID=1395130 RepID=A0A6A6S7U6_9PLEO|nr:hypothetical protein P280DRAFT_217935 [Massarina eburnea CBS 473.64]